MTEERLQFWLSTGTWWLMSQAGLYAAAELLAPLLSARWTLIVLVLLALSFLATRFVEIDKGLRQAALICFGGMAGILLVLWAPTHWGRFGGLAVLVTLIGASVALLVGNRLPGSVRTSGRWLVLFSWFYVAGWIAFWFLPAPAVWIRAWAALGALVFWGLIVLWASSLQAMEDLPDVARAGSQLTLLSLNLILSTLFLLGG